MLGKKDNYTFMAGSPLIEYHVEAFIGGDDYHWCVQHVEKVEIDRPDEEAFAAASLWLHERRVKAMKEKSPTGKWRIIKCTLNTELVA